MSRTILRAALLGVAAFALLTAGTSRSQPGANVRADLALVPADAVSFAHVRAADLWRTEPFKDFRELVARAGPKAFEVYNRRFVVTPASIDRVTLFVLPGPADDPQRMPPPLIVVSTTKPIDTARLVATYMPGAKAETLGVAGVFTDSDRNMTLYPVNPQTFVISAQESVRAMLSRPKPDDGPLKAAIAMAGSKHVTVALNAAAIPAEATNQAPPPFQPLVKANLATITLDVGAEVALDLRLRYANDAAATDAEKAARAGLQMARAKLREAKQQVGKPLLAPKSPPPSPLSEMPEALASLFGLGMIGTFDEILAKFPLSRDGTQLVVQAKLPAHSVPTIPLAVAAAGWYGAARGMELRAPAAVAVPGVPVQALVPPPVVGRIFEGKEAKAMNNMKQIGLALHNYASDNGHLPGHAIYSKDGKTPLLSWRVAILPYVEQDAVYRQFKLDEPWDSEHNMKVLKTHPVPTYMSPNAPPAKEPGMTHYKIFVGGGAAWDRDGRGVRFQDVTDGTSNTIMVVEAADPVPWTKPDDIDYDPKKPLPKLGANPDGNSALFLMMDGAVHKKAKTLAEAVLRAAITRAGGELLEW